MRRTLICSMVVLLLVCMSAVRASVDTAQKGVEVGKGYSAEMQSTIDVMQAKMSKSASTVNKNLKTFDTLDFVVFSSRDWVRLHESHSNNVVVNWPDGHHTNGIQRHIEDLKALFVYAPDTQIRVHPVRFGVYRGATGSEMTPDGRMKVNSIDGGDGFTCVTGIMTGTFTEPMPIGGGKVIQPTGKKFAIPMCTVGHWEKGVMTEEWLYWDNATYMKQIGIGG